MKRSLVKIRKSRFGLYTGEGNRGAGGAGSSSSIPLATYSAIDQSHISVVDGKEDEATLENDEDSTHNVVHGDGYAAGESSELLKDIRKDGAEATLDSMVDSGQAPDQTTDDGSFTVGEHVTKENAKAARQEALTDKSAYEVDKYKGSRATWEVKESAKTGNSKQEKIWEVTGDKNFTKTFNATQKQGPGGIYEVYSLKDKKSTDAAVTEEIYWGAMAKYVPDYDDQKKWPPAKRTMYMQWLEGSAEKPENRVTQMNKMSAFSGGVAGQQFNDPTKAFEESLHGRPAGSVKLTESEKKEFKNSKGCVNEYFKQYVAKYGPNSPEVWNLIYNAQFSDVETLYHFLRDDLEIEDNKEMHTSKEDVEANLSTKEDKEKHWESAAETKDRAVDQVGKAMEDEAEDFVIDMANDIKVGRDIETADKDYQTEMAKP